ncbi:MAG: phosphate ABC transporter permease PstA [Haloferacaceae archaeon]
MSTDTARTNDSLVQSETSGLQVAALGVVGVSVLVFALNWVVQFELVGLTDGVAGVSVFHLFAIATLLVGLGVLSFGALSRAGVTDTHPSENAGSVAAVLFGGIWFVVGGLVASQTLGLGTVGWVVGALVAGAAAFAVTVGLREDLGSTIPSGGLALFTAGAYLSGAITPAWTWSPTGFQASFLGVVVVPLLSAFVCLVAGWSASKAREGFGIRGRQRGAYFLIWLVVGTTLAILVVLVLYIVGRGYESLFNGASLLPFSIPFLMHSGGLTVDVKGILPAIVGTVWLVLGAVTFAVPLGVGAAVFLTEYAEQGGFTRVVETATNGLWSTPSIVFGLFGYAFLIPRFGNSKSLLAGMLVLGFMLLPLVLITSREALKSVPDEYRDASAALGVSQWQTIRAVVLPAAMPGVITGVILGVGRIAGETAPILLVSAGGVLPSRAPNILSGFQFTATPPFVTNPALLEPTSALPYQLFALITAGLGPSLGVDDPEGFAWGVALVLLLVVMLFYAVGIASRTYFRRKLHNE